MAAMLVKVTAGPNASLFEDPALLDLEQEKQRRLLIHKPWFLARRYARRVVVYSRMLLGNTWPIHSTVSVSPSSRPDETHEAAPASPVQRGAAAAPRALQEAHVAAPDTGQSQAHRGGHHGLCGEHDAAGAAGHVQQDGQSRCGPGPAKPGSNEARVGHPPRAGEVSLCWPRESQGYTLDLGLAPGDPRVLPALLFRL